MNDETNFLTVTDVAGLLGLHVKTVRQYVREGRLRSTRIGKQYRISRADFEAFAGATVAGSVAHSRKRHVEVSSIVAIDAISRESANRLTNTLLAASKGRQESASLRIETLYDEERAHLKLIIIGSMASTSALLDIAQTLIGEG